MDPERLQKLALFEIVTSHIGESYVRSYAWCDDETEARTMFEAADVGGAYQIKSIRRLFPAWSDKFVTVPSDEGFELNGP